MGGRAAGGEDAAAGGASDSSATGTRSIFFLDVQGNVLTFDEDTPTPRTLVSWAGTGPMASPSTAQAGKFSGPPWACGGRRRFAASREPRWFERDHDCANG
jgi:hypothetical protein